MEENNMTREEILSHVDHTLLKPEATWPQIQTICDEAIANHTASVCVKVRCALALWFLYVQQELLQTRRWGTPEAELVILAFSVSQILSAIF